MWFDCKNENEKNKTHTYQHRTLSLSVWWHYFRSIHMGVRNNTYKKNPKEQMKLFSKYLLNSCCCSKKTGHSEMLIKITNTNKKKRNRVKSVTCYKCATSKCHLPVYINEKNAHRRTLTHKYMNFGIVLNN